MQNSKLLGYYHTLAMRDLVDCTSNNTQIIRNE